MVISPSLPARSFDELARLVVALSGEVPLFQVDLVDGVFAPYRSWPFTEETDPAIELLRLRGLAEKVPLEMDCMVVEPERYLPVFDKLKIKSMIVHTGSTKNLSSIIKHAHAQGYNIGCAITNDQPIESVTPYMSELDFVQVMGIRDIGRQGQPFDTRTLDTLRELRRIDTSLQLVVDGAVNEDTAPLLREAGATRLAPGSYISTAPDPVAAYKQLRVRLSA